MRAAASRRDHLVMTGTAYEVSAEISSATGPFPATQFPLRRGGKAARARQCRADARSHRAPPQGVRRIDSTAPAPIRPLRSRPGKARWQGRQHGTGNAQVTVLAPTGTIGFLMDCDTTGIRTRHRPGEVQSSSRARHAQNCHHRRCRRAQGARLLDQPGRGNRRPTRQKDTSKARPTSGKSTSPSSTRLRPANGERSLHYRAHIRMMAAAQPFLSGAISKKVNLPNSATVEDIMQTYVEAWNLASRRWPSTATARSAPPRST